MWTNCYTWIPYNSNINLVLKLPFAGYRSWDTWYYKWQSYYSFYWSSSPTSNDKYSVDLYINKNNIDHMNNANRAWSYPIRCLKN